MKKGDLRVCVITNIPSEPRYYTVPSLEVGLLLINVLADEMLLCKYRISNVLMLEEYLGDTTEGKVLGWREWYDKDGNTIDEYEFKDDFKLSLKE